MLVATKKGSSSAACSFDVNLHYFFFSEIGLGPPVKYFTDRSKAVLILWIICVFFVSCVSHAFASVHCCLVATCGERADLLALVGDLYCIFVTFPSVILGQVWYLIVSFPDLCLLSYFVMDYLFAFFATFSLT